MSMDHHGGKGYTPLPQSISNTDTEDEDECLPQPKENHDEQTDRTISEHTTVPENGVYYPLDETRNLANRARNGQNSLKYYRDDIPIMVIEGNEQNDLWKRHDMSPIRQFCLVASILLCVATILIFLYILPCDNSMVCPPITEPQSSISWDKTLQGVELHGPISIIYGTPHSLIFLLRGQQYRTNDVNQKDKQQISSNGGGVISMQGNRGLPLWMVSLKRLPTEIDCISIDTDHSGKPDCIVAGEQGLLVSIDPIAGTINWNSETITFPKLPVILPDINSDGIEELLSVEVAVQSEPNLVVLSGKSGQLLGKYNPGNCTIDVYNLVLHDSISFLCNDGNQKHVEKSMTLKGFLHATKLLPVSKKIVGKPQFFKTLEKDLDKLDYALTPYHHLTLQNEGTCPGESCRASVNLTLQKLTNQPVTIWDYISFNSLASKPTFLFVSNQPYTSGFAIKFWQWIDPPSDQPVKASEIVEHKLIERVIIVLVNYTDVQVMNDISQNDITQLCQNNNCQPYLNSRLRFSSITLVNASDSGLPELVNYWSSYDIDSPKTLTSKVQVVKLDSNLPILQHANV